MKILTEQNGDMLRLECIGKFDAVAAPVFREEVSKTDLSQFGEIILDFESVIAGLFFGLYFSEIVRRRAR